MVTNDTTHSLARHMRRIEIGNGPSVSTKKNKLRKSRHFQVTELRLSWYGDDEPSVVIAYGFYLNKRGNKINANRAYDLAAGSVPKWIKDAVNG